MDQKFDNVFEGKVEELTYLGDHIRTRATVCGHTDFIVKVPNSGSYEFLKEGATAQFGWSSVDCRALEARD